MAPSFRLSRRAMLAALGATACAPAAPGEPGPASSRFPLGVASGEATPDGILLWTYSPGTALVKVSLWRDGEDTHEPLQTVDVKADADGLVHQPITGLEAGQWYVYRFVEWTAGQETARSELGRFRAALGDDVLAPLRLGAVSCLKQSFPLDPLLQAAQRGDLDAFLLLGDSVYADGAITAADYRAKWHDALDRYPNRRIRAATSLIATWDDHEVQNNFDGEPVPEAQLAAGRAGYFDFLPVRRQAAAPERLWRSMRWGRTAEFFILDCRGERNHATGEYLSAAQLAWLQAGLSASPAMFKIILNSVPISEFPGPLFATQITDRWEGFPAQRTALLRYIDTERIKGVLWISGDFHLGTLGRVSQAGPGSTAIEALVGPGGQAPNVSPTYPDMPQFDFATGINNFVIIDLEPRDGTARLRYISGTGKTLADRTYVLA